MGFKNPLYFHTGRGVPFLFWMYICSYLFREHDSHLFSCGVQCLLKKIGTKANTWSVLSLKRGGSCKEYQRTQTDDLKTSKQSAVDQCFLPEVSVTQSFHRTSPRLTWMNTKCYVRKSLVWSLLVGFIPHFHFMPVLVHRFNVWLRKAGEGEQSEWGKQRGTKARQGVPCFFFTIICPQVSFTTLADKNRAWSMLARYM